MVRIIMHGCNGHMGQVITGIVKEDKDAEIVAGIDLVDNRDNGYPVFKSLKDCDVEADVVIDFASAKAEDALIDACLEKKLPVVVCTTGLSEEQLAKIRKASREVAVLKSANMSLGVNTLLKLLQDAAKVLAPAGFDMEIVESITNINWTLRVEPPLPWLTASTRLWVTSTPIHTTAAAAVRSAIRRRSAFLLSAAEISWASMR